MSTILVVDDDAAMCDLLTSSLGQAGYEVLTSTTAESALTQLDGGAVDVIVTDLNMRGMNGIDLCARVVANRPDIPVLVMTAFGSLDTAIAAIRAGAYDFLTKPFEIDALELAVERAVRHRALQSEVRRLRRTVEDAQGFGDLLGESPAMRRVYDLLERVVDSTATVLVTGESGTGKELVARALHRRGRRSAGPFVAVNCSAVPEALLESELFGHVRGAFTDARAGHVGLFQQAHGGTLLLDEITELPLTLQPKLLRALQERVVRPVGGDREIPWDARVVAATNRDLEVAVEEGRFREDLYFRVNVIQVELPPLRSRGTDVLLLAQHFIDRAAEQAGRRVTGLLPAAAERLLAYAWPGNVRELQNCIDRAVALARYEQVNVDDLPEKIRNYQTTALAVASDDPEDLPPLEDVERRYILRVLSAVGGNKTLAARRLGVDRKTLYRKLEQWGVDEDPQS